MKLRIYLLIPLLNVWVCAAMAPALDALKAIELKDCLGDKVFYKDVQKICKKLGDFLPTKSPSCAPLKIDQDTSQFLDRIFHYCFMESEPIFDYVQQKKYWGQVSSQVVVWRLINKEWQSYIDDLETMKKIIYHTALYVDLSKGRVAQCMRGPVTSIYYLLNESLLWSVKREKCTKKVFNLISALPYFDKDYDTYVEWKGYSLPKVSYVEAALDTPLILEELLKKGYRLITSTRMVAELAPCKTAQSIKLLLEYDKNFAQNNESKTRALQAILVKRSQSFWPKAYDEAIELLLQNNADPFAGVFNYTKKDVELNQLFLKYCGERK